MAQFEALCFTFAGDSSLNYDLYIIEIGGNSGLQNESAGSETAITSDSSPRQAEQYVYGIHNSGVQKFSITFGSDTQKDRAEIDRIYAWLLQMKPYWLHIRQSDMEEYRYHGVFTNPNLITVGKIPFGVTITFECTSPYAYTFPRTTSLSILNQTKYVYNNISGDRDYLYPDLTIVPSNITQFISIINESDNRREFRFNFSPTPDGKEIITIDNRRQIIQSSVGYEHSRFRFNNFNMNWLRFVRGQNVLDISGASHIEITSKFAKRVGN